MPRSTQTGTAGGPTRPVRAKFVIQPFHDGRADTTRAKAYLMALRAGFRAVLANQAKQLTFTDLYNMAYRLVLWKCGEQLYVLCTDLLRLASLCTRESAFFAFAVMVRDITMYSERTHILIKHRVPLREYAKGVYARNVARLWRRVRHVGIKGAHVTRWRAAFDEVRFRPGGSGWLAARERFEGSVAAQALV